MKVSVTSAQHPGRVDWASGATITQESLDIRFRQLIKKCAARGCRNLGFYFSERAEKASHPHAHYKDPGERGNTAGKRVELPQPCPAGVRGWAQRTLKVLASSSGPDVTHRASQMRVEAASQLGHSWVIWPK